MISFIRSAVLLVSGCECVFLPLPLLITVSVLVSVQFVFMANGGSSCLILKYWVAALYIVRGLGEVAALQRRQDVLRVLFK